MMRKAFALLISVVIALSLFTGCYSVRIRLVDKNQTTAETDSTEKTTQSETKSTQTESEVKKEAVPWSGKVATSYESGSGTSEDPYEVATAEQLALLAQQANEGKVYNGMYYYLSNDIYLNSVEDVKLIAEIVASAYEEYSKDSENIRATTGELGVGIIEYLIDFEDYNLNEWTPIGTEENPFQGIFNGNSYTIYGLYSMQGNLVDIYSAYYYSYNGFFGYMRRGTISDVKVDSAIIAGSRFIDGEECHGRSGGIVGTAGNGTIEKCSVNNIWVEGYMEVGGIVGWAYGNDDDYITISNCVTHSSSYIMSDISGDSGGVVGDDRYCTNILRCFNYGNSDFGIVGTGLTDDSKVAYCMSLGISNYYAIGRFYSDSKVSSCFFSNTSSVDGSNRTLSGISTTSESNLRSFDWLVDNLGISDSIWYMSDGELYLK